MMSLGDFKKKLQEVEVLGKLDDVSAYASQVGGRLYKEGKHKEALHYHNKDLEASQEARNAYGEGDAHRWVGECYLELGDNSSALLHTKTYLEIARELQDTVM